MTINIQFNYSFQDQMKRNHRIGFVHHLSSKLKIIIKKFHWYHDVHLILIVEWLSTNLNLNDRMINENHWE